MNTCSFAFPDMFDVSKNRAAIYNDSDSIRSRVKLLMLTEPTELYNEPNYGLGLKRYLYRYNEPNIIPEIRDRLIEQLRMWEPCVEADATEVKPGLLYTDSAVTSLAEDMTTLKFTIILHTIYGTDITLESESGNIQ